ncbi:MAG: nucleotidyltransferase domain-containing protein [Thermoproteota archaeon]|jgi:predicted nucleotidyltransferase
MSLRKNQEYDLSKLIEAISSINEVIAIILFGSVARGDYDEYSDYDLLVVFKDKSSMWKRWNEVFEKAGELKLLLHMIPKSLDEFLNSEPTFLEEIFKHGKLLYSKYPFQSYMKPLNLKRMYLLVYNMRNLKQKDKMKLFYRLYGKRKNKDKGLVNKLGGLRVNNGCIIVPEENIETILRVLREHGAETKIFKIYLDL